MRKYSIAMPEINKLPKIGGCNYIDGKPEWPELPYWPDELERTWWPDKSFPPDRIQERWWENCQICEIVSARDASASEKYKILRQADIVRFSLNFV